tara:strand:- start:8079 stop:8738 length:660 start_codon:yes stop_codon:yes gene_type:complete
MFETNPVQISLIKKCYDYDRFSDAGYQWRKVFVVDDFYKNPDEVRDYALSCQRTNDKEHCGGLIGTRVVEDRPDMIENLKPVFQELCQHPEWTNLQFSEGMFDYRWDNQKFWVNHTTNEDINERFTKTVHCFTHHKDDNSSWAALVYLNKDEECEGGTDFYKYLTDHAYGDYNIRKDIQFTCPMKYNRMVMYEAECTHGADINRKMFKEYPRLAQVFFM